MEGSRKIDLMERLTKKYSDTVGIVRCQREIICLREFYPGAFGSPLKNDFFVGRTAQLPIRFNLDWANMCHSTEKDDEPIFFGVVENLQSYLQDATQQDDIDAISYLLDFWKEEDIQINSSSTNCFDYEPLLKKGILGYERYLQSLENNDKVDTCIQGVHLFIEAIDFYIDMLEGATTALKHKQQMIETLKHLKKYPPITMHHALQLVFLYSQITGTVGYGRLDESLAPFDTNMVNVSAKVANFLELLNSNHHLTNMSVTIDATNSESTNVATMILNESLHLTNNRIIINEIKNKS